MSFITSGVIGESTRVVYPMAQQGIPALAVNSTMQQIVEIKQALTVLTDSLQKELATRLHFVLEEVVNNQTNAQNYQEYNQAASGSDTAKSLHYSPPNSQSPLAKELNVIVQQIHACNKALYSLMNRIKL